jgi:hypothetical protein
VSDRNTLWLYCSNSDCALMLPLLRATLLQSGISIFHPSLHGVSVLSESGEQHVLSLDAVYRRLIHEGELNLQWWLNEGEDVYCRIRLGEGAAVFLLAFEGIEDADERRVIKALSAFAMELGMTGHLIGFAFDQLGEFGDVDWDSFFLGSSELAEVPAVLCVRADLMPRITAAPTGVEIVDGRYRWYGAAGGEPPSP